MSRQLTARERSDFATSDRKRVDDGERGHPNLALGSVGALHSPQAQSSDIFNLFPIRPAVYHKPYLTTDLGMYTS